MWTGNGLDEKTRVRINGWIKIYRQKMDKKCMTKKCRTKTTRRKSAEEKMSDEKSAIRKSVLLLSVMPLFVFVDCRLDKWHLNLHFLCKLQKYPVSTVVLGKCICAKFCESSFNHFDSFSDADVPIYLKFVTDPF